MAGKVKEPLHFSITEKFNSAIKPKAQKDYKPCDLPNKRGIISMKAKCKYLYLFNTGGPRNYKCCSKSEDK
jgi:hypothetical protein